MNFWIFQKNKKRLKKTFFKIGLFCVFSFLILSASVDVVDTTNTICVSENGSQYYSGVESEKAIQISLMQGAEASFMGGVEDFLINVPVKFWTEGEGSGWISGAASAAAKPFVWTINFILNTTVNVLGVGLRVAGAFIDLSINSDTIQEVMIDNPGVYLGWSFLRDVLNLFFMFILLFSAFATIFQVEKYHLKKIIILLVVMALLTNFSFPITLFVIDFSNSAMFFLAGNMFGDGVSPSASLNGLLSTGPFLKNVMDSANGFEQIEIFLYQIMFLSGVLFISFIYGIMFFVRLVVLMFLLILSPVGFVFAIFPGTKSLADSWWSNLFKYATMGPIMLFSLLMAFVVFAGSMKGVSGDQVEGFFNNVVIGVSSMIFLGVGFVFSQKIGGVASTVGSKVTSFTANGLKKGAMGAARLTGIPGGIKQRYDYVKGRTEAGIRSRESQVAGMALKLPRFAETGRFGTGAIGKALNVGMVGAEKGVAATTDPAAQKKMVAEQAKSYENEDKDVLKTRAKTGDAGAAYRLAQDGNMDNATYTEVVAKTKDKNVMEMIDGKVKEKRVDLVINRKIKEAGHTKGTHAAQGMAEAELLKLNKDAWSKLDFNELLNDGDMQVAAHEIFNDNNKMDQNTRNDIRKNVSGENLVAMDGSGLV
ncbi:type IV secretion system protein [Patescibacteria group bacterium]